MSKTILDQCLQAADLPTYGAEDAMKAEEGERALPSFLAVPGLIEPAVGLGTPLAALPSALGLLAEAEDLSPEVGDWHPGLPIGSEADLGRAIAFLRNRRHEANEAKRRAAQTIRDTEAWLSKRLHGVKGVETQATALEVRILVYAREHPEVFAGKKTAKFPAGSVAKRERKEGYYRKLPGAVAGADLLAWVLQEKAAGRVDPNAEPLVNPSQELVVNLDRVKEYLETISTNSPGNGGVGHRVTAPGLEWVEPGTDYSVKTGE